MRRMQELQAWIGRLDPREGVTVEEDDYVVALQLRLGARLAPEAFECPECGSLVDSR